MPERQILVKPLGLVTQPNKLGVFPPGAMSQAKDMIVRSPAALQQAYTKTPNWGSLISVNHRARLLYSTASQLIVLQRTNAGVWACEWWTPALAGAAFFSATLPYVTDSFSTTGRLQAITMRGRTIINGATKDSIVADYENPTTAAERTFRLLGLPQPGLRVLGTSATNAQAVNANTTVCYATLLKRTYPDEYELVSRPSLIQRFRVLATSNALLEVDWLPGTGVVAGDVVEIYRSQSVPAPVGGENAGTTLYLVGSITLDAPAAAAGFVAFTDSALASDAGGPLGGLGREMYTNPDLGGLTQVHDPPPVAACTAVFRDRAWYANCKFPALLKLSFRRGVGILISATERTNGIGTRQVTATLASGNTTLTAISATDILGLVPGQSVFFPAIPVVTTIVSVGATSIVVANAPTSSPGAQVGSITDVLEIDGQKITAQTFIQQGLIDSSYTMTSSRTLDVVYSSSQDFEIQKTRYVAPATITIRATHGAQYDPPVPEIGLTAATIQPTARKNYVRYSLDQEPEAVPTTNELWVGTGEIYAMIPTRDVLWFFCSDGLFRLSGTIAPIEGVPDIRVDPIDSSISLAGPRAWCVLRDKIFAYTNVGFVEISDDGIRPISLGVVGDLLPGQRWAESETPYLLADSRVDEIYIMGAHATLNFVYSLRYQVFTTTSQFDASSVGVQVASTLALAFGYSGAIQVDELQPDLTALLSTGPIADFQPVFGNRPDTIKQWIDAIYIMELGSTGTLDPRFNGASASAETLLTIGNDMRASVGVPRDAPALGPSIAPGYAVLSAGLKELSGISLRYATFTEQSGAR